MDLKLIQGFDISASKRSSQIIQVRKSDSICRIGEHQKLSRTTRLRDVIIVKYFKCVECEHYWAITFCEDSEEINIACPACKSLKVHQIEKVRGWDREGKYTSPVKEDDRASASPESSSVRKVFLKAESPPPEAPAKQPDLQDQYIR
jgi:hypothetical protein